MTTVLPRDRLPQHVAFIMDGNGRWAKTTGKLRIHGHEKGAESLREITRYCRQIGIREVTFYALSTENYHRRPAWEIRFLMNLLKRFLINERSELLENAIRLAVIGNIGALPDFVRREIDETLRLTANLDGMVMRLALNYGSRQEILDAVGRAFRDVQDGTLGPTALETLDEETFRNYLDDPRMPDPDLVIRTAGEFRLSNFLLWQSSYSELWITDRLWPDFDVCTLEEALAAYVSRERKYGAIGRLADGSEEIQPPGTGLEEPGKGGQGMKAARTKTA